MNEPIGIITGLRSEAAIVRAALRYQPDAVRPRIACIAGDAARAGPEIAAMLDRGPLGGVVSFGMAGGLDAALSPGAIVLPRFVVGPDGQSDATDGPWRDALIDGLARGSLAIRTETLAGSDHVLASPDDKKALRENVQGAVAVDMESHGVGAAARRHGLPFLVIRAIADPAARSLPTAALVGMGPDGETRAWAVLAALLRDPRQLPALFALAGDARRAAACLRRVCLLGVPSFCLPGG